MVDYVFRVIMIFYIAILGILLYFCGQNPPENSLNNSGVLSGISFSIAIIFILDSNSFLFDPHYLKLGSLYSINVFTPEIKHPLLCYMENIAKYFVLGFLLELSTFFRQKTGIYRIARCEGRGLGSIFCLKLPLQV